MAGNLLRRFSGTQSSILRIVTRRQVKQVLLAFAFRKWDRVPLVRYDWEDDDSVPDWYPEKRDD